MVRISRLFLFYCYVSCVTFIEKVGGILSPISAVADYCKMIRLSDKGYALKGMLETLRHTVKVWL